MRIKEEVRKEIVINKSRFIACISRCFSEEEAKAYYEKASREAEEQSKREIERIAKLEADGGKVYEVKGVKFAMVAVEGGTFKMGSESGDSDEKPIHEVTLNGFAIGQTEVTQD